jgi:hypothetical protein
MKRIFEIYKNITAISKDKENPFFKSKYFDINDLVEQLKPMFAEKNLMIVQPLGNNGTRNIITTEIIDTETGNIILCSGGIFLPDIIDPQKMGSAITYFRRYDLVSLLFLQAEDDDAKKASKKDIDTSKPIEKLNKSKTLAELSKNWNSLTQNERNNTEIATIKDELKKKLV